MDSTNNTPSSLCEKCALFGADYSKRYSKWIHSNEAEKDQGRFQIPYHLTDSCPRLPRLNKSAGAGCGLCAAFVSSINQQLDAQKTIPWQRLWKRQYVELKAAFKLDPIQGFDPTTQLALGLRIEFIHKEKLLGIPRTTSRSERLMEIVSTSQGSGSVSPPVLPMASEDKLCSRNINLIHRWLNECEGNHPLCKNSQITNFLPTRLLCVKSKNYHLVETAQLSVTERQSARYLALSHCWGPRSDLHYQTISQNIHARLHGIEFADLPQNIQDAISVTQALGLEYLWIDSICIIQDKPEDIETEIRIMLDVYANAYVTISATCASSVEEGFLRRATKPEQRITIPRQSASKLYPTGDSLVVFPDRDGTNWFLVWSEQVAYSPWSQRAWTLQESLTSPRIVHFGKERLFFECATLDYLEGADISRPLSPGLNAEGPYGHIIYRSANFLRRQKVMALNNNIKPEAIQQLYQDYYTVVQIYTGRKLTFAEDRAAACSSIVDAVTRITKSSAKHGLLMDDLYQGLLWNRGFAPNNQFKCLEALDQWPSWSWLSFPGQVEFGQEDPSTSPEERDVIRLAASDELAQSVEAEQSDSNNMQLRLNGYLLEVSLQKFDNVSWGEFQVFAMGQAIGYARLDFDEPPVHPVPLSIFIFSLSVKMMASERNPLAPIALILVLHENTSYQRIGVFHKCIRQGQENQSNNDAVKILRSLERQQVTLV